MSILLKRLVSSIVATSIALTVVINSVPAFAEESPASLIPQPTFSLEPPEKEKQRLEKFKLPEPTAWEADQKEKNKYFN